MKAEIIRITAMGYSKRYLTIKYDDKIHTILIPPYMYDELRNYDIPTGQSLRKKK